MKWYMFYGNYVQPAMLRYVPLHIRGYSAFLFHLLFQLGSSLTLIILSPFLYSYERFHARSVALPLPYSHLLITGASSGVGESLCHSYARKGVRIVMVARNEEQLNLVAEKVSRLGAEVKIEVMDVGNKEGMERVIREAEQVKPLDIVFAVAGHECAMGANEEITAATRDVISTNIIGTMNTILPAIPFMRQRRRGQLVLFSSQLGYFAAPLATDYDSSKVFLRIYGEGLRTLLRPCNIAVNVVVPGGMATPMMNTLTERSQLPMIPFMLPTENAVKVIREGVERNFGVVSFPTALTAFNSAVGSWPWQARDLFLCALTTKHQLKWRLGEIDDYKDKPGKGKKDDYYAKERKQEKTRQQNDLKDQ